MAQGSGIKKFFWFVVTLASVAALVVGVGIVRPETPVAGLVAERALMIGKALLGDSRSKENVAKMARNSVPNKTYYQYTTDRGQVRFAESLSDVPPQWRKRAGSVRMASPPPLTPGQAAAQREAQTIANAPPPITRVPTVIVYTAKWDEGSQRMLKWLEKNEIEHFNRDVDERDRYRQELFDKTGGDFVPSFDINGKTHKGFSASRFRKAYKEAAKVTD